MGFYTFTRYTKHCHFILRSAHLFYWLAVSDCLPTTVANGDVDFSAGTTYGANATITCDAGFNVSGSGRIQCLETGLWDTTSECVIIGMMFIRSISFYAS